MISVNIFYNKKADVPIACFVLPFAFCLLNPVQKFIQEKNPIGNLGFLFSVEENLLLDFDLAYRTLGLLDADKPLGSTQAAKACVVFASAPATVPDEYDFAFYVGAHNPHPLPTQPVDPHSVYFQGTADYKNPAHLSTLLQKKFLSTPGLLIMNLHSQDNLSIRAVRISFNI